MNEFSITPFRGPHLLLLLLTVTAVLFILLLLRGKPEARRSRYLIGVCFFNLALFAGYKLSLSMDATYIHAYYPNGFSIFNELPLHLCNINLFLIPLGVWKRNRSIMGFSFFVAPLGALMALLFPELSAWRGRRIGQRGICDFPTPGTSSVMVLKSISSSRRGSKVRIKPPRPLSKSSGEPWPRIETFNCKPSTVIFCVGMVCATLSRHQ